MHAFDYATDPVYATDYLRFLARLTTDEASDAQTEALVRLLDLPPGSALLDIPCGHGRIARRLAARGYAVTGVESNRLFLDVARAAGGGVTYLEADMRTFAPASAFDGVVCWFSSLGYHDDATEQSILGAWHRALRPGGVLVIEHQNLQRLHRILAQAGGRAERTFTAPGGRMRESAAWDPAGHQMLSEWEVEDTVGIRRYAFGTRGFEPEELSEWLLQAGFPSVTCSDLDGTPFSAESRRMVLVARA